MKILGAQINVILGALRANTDHVLSIIANTANDVNFLVFPELTLTGYPPADLLLQSGFVQEQLDCAAEILEATKTKPYLNVVLGLATFNTGKGKRLRNSLVVYKNGEERLRYHKQLLPTYNVFDEFRYFEPGSENQKNILKEGDKVFGFIICEDAWNDTGALYKVNPVADARKNQTDVLITINASPSHILKNRERYAMYGALATKYNMAIVYVNQVGGHDSLIFDGYSFAVTPGDMGTLTAGYKEALLHFNTETIYGFVQPFLRSQKSSAYEEMFNHLVLGVRDYVQKNGFKSVVVGSSGGIDSALVLAIAQHALGKENVFAITMPSKFSSAGSVDDSVELCRNLGIKLYTRSIAAEVMNSVSAFGAAFGEDPSRLTIENEQARIRGRILMEFSNHFGALVLSTGNKSEISCGYFTLYGDSNGGLAVIADLYKTEVSGLAKWYNEHVRDYDTNMPTGIPDSIINKAPSAELWENQKDTDSLPPYDALDGLLRLFLEGDLLDAKTIQESLLAIKDLSPASMLKIIDLLHKVEFKRQQLPPTIRVHNRSWGAGRVMPITHKYRMNESGLFSFLGELARPRHKGSA